MKDSNDNCVCVIDWIVFGSTLCDAAAVRGDASAARIQPQGRPMETHRRTVRMQHGQYISSNS